MEIDVVDNCLKIACHASASASNIYNLIRAVGREELSADNALHQMVEEYHNLRALSDKASALADALEKKEGK